MRTREIRLERVPPGVPCETDFEIRETTIDALRPGQVLVKNTFLSIDPYTRNRMKSVLKPNDLIPGRCVGEVIESMNTAFHPGQKVLSACGWREHFVAQSSDLQVLDGALGPLQLYLGIAGSPGLTAYVGLLDYGRPRPGETVFISAAGGAVGSLAAQIAKFSGCKVIACAGSAAKAAWLTEVAGVTAAINYRDVPDLSAEVARLCPEGIDVLFETVGDQKFDVLIGHMRPHGRIVLVGLIGRMNDAVNKPGLTNLEAILMNRLTIHGFGVNDHMGRMPEFRAVLKRWIAERRVAWRETIVDDISNAPNAFIGLFSGENFGKMLVRLDPTAEAA